MTKEEAIKKANVNQPWGSREQAKMFVERLEALGLISFEEPKSLQSYINDAIWNNLWDKYNPSRNIAPMDIVNALEKAGLKIVKV